ncbi:MAG: hypothetical protein ACO3LE_01515 [Bdellovibrionota bacterium]
MSKDWKEIDQARIRGQKTERKKSALELRAEKKASSEAKAQLEKLFQESPLSKEKQARVNSIRALQGKSSFNLEIEKYIQEFGLPRDWPTLSLFLDHSGPQYLVQILTELSGFLDRFGLSEQEMLLQKLKVLELSTFDRDLVNKIRELKKLLVVS